MHTATKLRLIPHLEMIDATHSSIFQEKKKAPDTHLMVLEPSTLKWDSRPGIL